MKLHILATLALCAATLNLSAATPADDDLTHSVSVTPGRITLAPGDSIVIDSIHGTSNTISAGNIYRVDGHYTLGSRDEAQLAINVTNGDGDSHAGTRPKDVVVMRGQGTFSLYFRMNSGGDAHLSFYPSGHGGESFASVYFNGPDAWSRQSGSPIHDEVRH